MYRHRLELIVCLFLIMATLAVYWQVRNHDFVNYDDKRYVTENSHVQAGLTGEGIIWAFTATHASNWHPLTWLSHMLDCQIYGLNAYGHHLTSLLFHLINTLLLFAVLKRMTGAHWQSAFVAALFALHPLHVESVAWVAERKDVLSAFFWLLTIWAYVRYVECPRVSRYLPVLVFFALGLMAKPMLVTLPFVLLLMDYWPLGRLRIDSLSTFWGERGGVRGALLEKIPLFALAAVSSLITIIAQQSSGALVPVDELSLKLRIANALVSYVSYIGKMIWPHDLAVLYPHARTLVLWQAGVAALLLLSISVLVIRAMRRSPYLATGWLWYLGTLVPVIGLVQVGAQSMADRYTYLPLIGLFIMIAWGVPDLMARWRYGKLVLAASAGVTLFAIMICTCLQVRHWQNTITLFRHTLSVTVDNCLAHNNLGLALAKQGKHKKAISHYSEALRIKPDYGLAHMNLGIALARHESLDKAIGHLCEAVRISPDDALAHYILGVALAEQGRLEEAASHYSEAVRLKPKLAMAHPEIGPGMARQGSLTQAIKDYSKAVRIRPDDPEAHNNLGLALTRQGKYKEAISHYSEALRIKPDYAEAHNNMGLALTEQGRLEEAIGHYTEAVRIKPKLAVAHNNLGIASAMQGKPREAVAHFSRAIRIKPDYAGAHKNLSQAYWLLGDRGSALREYEIVKSLDERLANKLLNWMRARGK